MKHLPSRAVLASSNPGKVRELQHLLQDMDMQIQSQAEFSVPDIEETGLTFVENAILKARNAAQYCNMAAIADDSGLEVDALDGAPGIYSARYAGVGASDQQNLEKLLREIAGVREEQRSARFQCIIVMLRHAHDPTPLICQGTWEGRILETPRGKSGFGYDPVFLVPALGRSAAELTPELKNRMSHRGQALQQLLMYLSR